MPKVSVIMPTYNVERYFVQCLESVLNQTLEDIEIIPVNDGTPDNCGRIMDEYAARDSRIRPIHQENSGYGKAVNVGIDAAQGKYIAIVETDDWINKDMLETLYDNAEKSNLPIVKASFTKIINGKSDFNYPLKPLTLRQVSDVKITECIPLMLMESSIWSAIYRLDFLNKHGIRMIETKGAAYQDLVFKFMVYSLSYKIRLIDKPVYNYRVFSIGSSSTDKSKAMVMFDNYKKVRTFLEMHNIFHLFKDCFYYHQAYDFVFHMNRLTGEGLKKFIVEAKKCITEMEENGVDIYQTPCTNDGRDYLFKHVIPLYERIKKGNRCFYIWHRFKVLSKTIIKVTILTPIHHFFYNRLNL